MQPEIKLTPAQEERIAMRMIEILDARQRVERDLAAEIEAYLADHPPATVPKIAFDICAREGAVRKTLTADDRFQGAGVPPGRSPKIKCWEVVIPDSVTQPCPRRSDDTP